MTSTELYGDLQSLSDKIRERGKRSAGHSSRTEESASKLNHWEPKYGRRKHGRPKLTSLDVLKKDTGLETAELLTGIQDKTLWRAITLCRHHPNKQHLVLIFMEDIDSLTWVWGLSCKTWVLHHGRNDTQGLTYGGQFEHLKITINFRFTWYKSM